MLVKDAPYGLLYIFDACGEGWNTFAVKFPFKNGFGYRLMYPDDGIISDADTERKCVPLKLTSHITEGVRVYTCDVDPFKENSAHAELNAEYILNPKDTQEEKTMELSVAKELESMESESQLSVKEFVVRTLKLMELRKLEFAETQLLEAILRVVESQDWVD